MARTRQQLTGRRFGRYIVASVLPRVGNNQQLWCRCDCGIERFVSYSNLVSGRTQSCGCFCREKNAYLHRKHGQTGSPEYRAWKGIKERCFNPANPSYADYGGRGITVCDEWKNNFTVFLRDMGLKPSPKHSIDRKDNEGNYEPANCRWATVFEQQRNTRRSRYVEIDGVKMTLAEASVKIGVASSTIWMRLRRHGSVFAP